MGNIKIWEHNKFRKSLLELQRRGGSYQRAAERIYALLGELQSDPSALGRMPVTNHGENRVPKAVKYDLTGACRLITIQDAGYAFFCFAGHHDDCDRWLEKNRGLRVKAESDGKPLVIFESSDVRDPEQRLERGHGMVHRPLLELLPGEVRTRLLAGAPRLVARIALEANSAISDDELLEIFSSIANERQASALFDVLLLLRDEDAEAAHRRARLYFGELDDVADVVAADRTLVDSEDFRRVSIDAEQYRLLIEHYAKSGDYRDWMLFMHPDQQKYVDAVYSGPAKLSGVSGSGKTCVLVNRAILLADRYAGQKILVLTLNRSLASLIETLVDKAAPVDARSRIHAMPLFELCQALLMRYEPGNEKLYDDVTWKSREHIDEIWREFYRCELNNESAKVLHRVHDSLIGRGLDAESYLREEFDWIRSATLPEKREDYLKIERRGRSHPLDVELRRDVLDGLAQWEGKMRAVGVTDYLGITSAAARYLHLIEPEYRCVLVDESQDFGTVELALVRHLVKPSEDDIFLCGDAAQQVSAKHQSLTEAGMPIPGGRSTWLLLNYRNSREVLEVAHEILVDNLSEEMLDAKDFDVLDPRYANFSGPVPLLLKAGSVAEEVHWALQYANEEASTAPGRKICIAVCGYTRYELTGLSELVGVPLLDGTVQLQSAQVFLSDLEDTKGFEFHTMVILNAAAGVLPNPQNPEKEQFRDLSRFYVAMTRAQSQLIVSYSGAVSLFVGKRQERFLEDSWSAYLKQELPASEVDPRFAPPRLDDIRPDNIGQLSPADMTGQQFLYLDDAIGLPSNVIEKLRTSVTGRSRLVSRGPVEWKSMACLIRDLRGSTVASAKARNSFGPEATRVLLRHLAGNETAEATTEPSDG